jgi:hypothetical protein
LLLIPLALLLTYFGSITSSWAWSTDPTLNTSIFAGLASASEPHLVMDGLSGAIVISGSNNGPSSDGIYIQRIDANGSNNRAWPAGGLLQSLQGQDNSQIITDGQGGSFIIWEGYRADKTSVAVYVQRIDANGTVHSGWSLSGLAVSSTADDQSFPQIASDGNGGIIVVWQDLRNGVNYDIYSQRISAGGSVLWGAGGCAVSITSADKLVPQLSSVDTGGAIITWEDYRTSGSGGDIYAQRIDGNGAPQWVANGVAVSAKSNDQVNPLLVSDSQGGAIIVWNDYRNAATGRGEANGGNSNIYAQRVDAAGNMLWSADGVAVASSALTNQYNQQIISDAAGGALVVWEDNRASSDGSVVQIWAQRLLPDGTSGFGLVDGVRVSQATGNIDMRNPQLIPDGSPGAQGAFIVWQDNRNSANGTDIYAQRIAANGSRVWTVTDTAVSTAVKDQLFPKIISDNNGGAIIAWEDFRSGTQSEIYAQRINGNGTLSGVQDATVVGDCDFNGIVTIAEVQGGINMFLGLKSTEACVDQDGDGAVSIAEVQKVINSFLGL